MTRRGLRSSIGYNQLAGIKAQLQSSSIMRIVSMTQHGAMHYNFLFVQHAAAGFFQRQQSFDGIENHTFGFSPIQR